MNTMRFLGTVGAAGLTLTLSNPVRATPRIEHLNFEADFDGHPITCARTLTPVGTKADTIRVNDLRFYIYDVAFLTSDGHAIPALPAPATLWQHGAIALIDLIDRNVPCSPEAPSPNSSFSYLRPTGRFIGLRFKVGLPLEANHGDPTTAPPPLNMTSMFWTWQLGYRFFTLDVTVLPRSGDTRRPHGFPVHLGSTGCESASPLDAPKKACNAPNIVDVTLPDFDPTKDRIALDIKSLLGSSDVGFNGPNSAPGCMSDPDDADCRGVFHEVGLRFGQETRPPVQAVFRASRTR